MNDCERCLAESWPPAIWQDVTVLLAVSGGADSVALLRGMCALRSGGEGRLIVAHFNHRLRQSESDDDEAFVVQLCRTLDVPCHVSRAESAGSIHRGSGLEASARETRYQFFRSMALEQGARYVATAHTADDQAETVLHRIVRGTGLAGLAGIPRTRILCPAVALIRPLLVFRRAELIAYLESLGQSFRRDASNANHQFTRNRIRGDLLPRLARDYNENVVEALLRLAALAAEAQNVIDTQVRDLSELCVSQTRTNAPVQIDCEKLTAVPPYLIRELLISVWRTQNWPQQAMGYQHWQSLAKLVLDRGCGMSSKQDFPGQVHAELRERTLWLTREPGSRT